MKHEQIACRLTIPGLRATNQIPIVMRLALLDCHLLGQNALHRLFVERCGQKVLLYLVLISK